MEPIISPWIIYIVSVVSKINNLLDFLLVMSTIVLAVALFVAPIMMDNGHGKALKKILKYSGIVFTISGFLGVVIPDKDTLIAMLAAQYVTPDNVQAVQGNIAEFVSNIIKATKQ